MPALFHESLLQFPLESRGKSHPKKLRSISLAQISIGRFSTLAVAFWTPNTSTTEAACFFGLVYPEWQSDERNCERAFAALAASVAYVVPSLDLFRSKPNGGTSARDVVLKDIVNKAFMVYDAAPMDA